MGHKKRTYEIEVTAGDPPVRLLSDGNVVKPDDRIIFSKRTDQMRKVDHYRIRFKIKDFGDSRLRFVPNRDDVFWVQEGTECPKTRCGLPQAMWVDKIDDDGKWIDVINMNLAELQFQFTLNFVDKTISNPTKDDYVELDPGGGNENQGGGGSGFTFDAFAAFAVLALGFGAGLAAFFGARLFFAGW